MASLRRELLVPGAPWTVAIVIDATLQKRSSMHTRNSQKFNHGKGFVVGHQWTNIVLLINEQTIPLPPIAFISKAERRRLNLRKETEHQAVTRYLETIDLEGLLGPIESREVVVLMDAGYDNKIIQKTIIRRGWDFVGNLKCSRSVRTDFQSREFGSGSYRIDKLFWSCRKSSPWQTVRTVCNGQRRKRMEFRAREKLGYLKGVPHLVKLVLSEERGSRKGRKYLACSDSSVSLGAVVRIYRKRWRVELFHKDVKFHLGFEDVSCHDFSSVSAHVHWVYCAYLLLPLLGGKKSRLSEAIRELKIRCDTQKMNTILQLASRFAGMDAIKAYCHEVILEAMAA